MDEPTPEEWERIASFFLYTGAVGDKKSKTWQNLYRRFAVSKSSGHTLLPFDEAVLSSHAQLRTMIEELRADPNLTLQEFDRKVFKRQHIKKNEKEHALTTIIWLGFMLDFRMRDNFSTTFLQGDYEPVRWEAQTPFVEFIHASLPKSETGVRNPCTDLSTIAAWKLKKRYNIKIERTDNIAEHLLYHTKPRVLRVFHHIGYLRAQLRRLQSEDSNKVTTEVAVRLGTHPPQLIFEVLESFYMLFPIKTDERGHTKALLNNLIDAHGFDPQAARSDSLYKTPPDFKYFYLGLRLDVLSDIVANPPPTNRFMSMMQRLSKSDRAALVIAIFALFLSSLLGLLACLIGAAQLYVSIRAWKEPVSPVTESTLELRAYHID